MQITRSDDTKTLKGPADWFTGDVYIDAVADPAGTSTFAAVNVHFSPRARTAWHTHPHGQTSSLPRASASASAKGARSRSSARATACSSSRARTTGTAPHRTASWSTAGAAELRQEAR